MPSLMVCLDGDFDDEDMCIIMRKLKRKFGDIEPSFHGVCEVENATSAISEYTAPESCSEGCIISSAPCKKIRMGSKIKSSARMEDADEVLTTDSSDSLDIGNSGYPKSKKTCSKMEHKIQEDTKTPKKLTSRLQRVLSSKTKNKSTKVNCHSCSSSVSLNSPSDIAKGTGLCDSIELSGKAACDSIGNQGKKSTTGDKSTMDLVSINTGVSRTQKQSEKPNVLEQERRPVRKRKLEQSDTSDNCKYVALDCEFVGVGPRKTDALGRCSIVDYHGNILCDIYAKPNQPVTDYRTRWSGIRRSDLTRAVPFESAQNIVSKVIKDKIVVGHAVYNDFRVLKIDHPREMIRDTARCKRLRDLAGYPANQPVSLKKFAAVLLGRQIQIREHCSVEDSRATMALFKLVQHQWTTRSPSSNSCKKRKLNGDKPRNNVIGGHDLSDKNDPQDSYLDDAYWPQDIWG